MSFVARCFVAADSQERPLYKCHLLRSEDPVFGAKPQPTCPANFVQGKHVVFFLSSFLFSFPRFAAWPLELGLGTRNPRFPLELGLGTHNPRFVAWPLELEIGTRNRVDQRIYIYIYIYIYMYIYIYIYVYIYIYIYMYIYIYITTPLSP